MPHPIKSLLTAGSTKDLRRYQKRVPQINKLEDSIKPLSDEELAHKTVEFKKRLADGATLNDILPEAYAVMREASCRTLGMRHFDVQLIGGMALNDGKIAELATGEGKTLVANLAGYLNALTGEPVHIVTVNDYLAQRDADQMRRPYGLLGMTVGCILNNMDPGARKKAYACDITYGTNNEFGFDYLRDNMVTNLEDRVQRGRGYAVVDEVDSILIDEARTPLIISGKSDETNDIYKRFASAVRGLERGEAGESVLGGDYIPPTGDYVLDESKRTVTPTERGIKKVENRLNTDIYADNSGELVNHLMQALKAEYLFKKDKDYIIADGEVKIVDEFTGRIMEGRRWSDGLHQAVEAKEGVKIKEENRTLATITLQNYFRLYDKLSGMTGTAKSDDAEFRSTYGLEVVSVPTNRPVIRKDHPDIVFQTEAAKYAAVVEDIAKRHKKGQPCLVGTTSVESSERLSHLLTKRGIKHEVLNAKYHAREAKIVAQAGISGAVTVATNMAGRGTDILLGGNPEGFAREYLLEEGIEPAIATDEQYDAAYNRAKARCDQDHKLVVAAGGLCVIGTERHESRRIDNQLRGRAGRQGDPGESQFYLSLDDELMRRFGNMDKAKASMKSSGIGEDEPIQSRIVSRAIESSQHKAESANFELRKRVLEYDDVINEQRKALFEERDAVLYGKNMLEMVPDLEHDLALEQANSVFSNDKPSAADIDGMKLWLQNLTGDTEGMPTFSDAKDADDMAQAAVAFMQSAWKQHIHDIPESALNDVAKDIFLRTMDSHWVAYLQEMAYLREGIQLRGYAQRDPLVEYRNEAWEGFQSLIDTLYKDFLTIMLHIQVHPAIPVVPEEPTPDPQEVIDTPQNDEDADQPDIKPKKSKKKDKSTKHKKK